MTFIRWHAFRFISWLGWLICPEPHRSRLQSMLPGWSDLEPELSAAIEGDLINGVRDIEFGGRS